MGGGGWFYVPKVWTPAGGWWNAPKNWKGNTAVAGIVIFGIAATVFNVSRQLERRPVAPVMTQVPSARWVTHPPGESTS